MYNHNLLDDSRDFGKVTIVNTDNTKSVVYPSPIQGPETMKAFAQDWDNASRDNDF